MYIQNFFIACSFLSYDYVIMFRENVRLDYFQRVSLELVVADYDRIGSSDPIGRVEVGYNRKGMKTCSISQKLNQYISIRAGAEALERDGRESKKTNCSLARPQGM